MLYLSGPMRGYDLYNYPAFEKATAILREAGYTVYTPHEADETLDLPGFDPNVPGSFTEAHRHTAMRADIEAILAADGVAVLPGWEESEGATLEVSVAKAIGLPVMTVSKWRTRAITQTALNRSLALLARLS